MWAKRQCDSLDCEIVRAFRVDFDLVAAICGLVKVDVGALRGAFGSAFGSRLVDEMLGWLVTEDVGVLGGVLGTVIGGVPRSPSKVDAVCAHAVLDMQ